MTSYVLIHGGVEGAWCWDPILPLLQAAEGVHEVVAVDLPGFGDRRLTDHDQVTLEDSVATVVGAVEERDLHDVVLVGHVAGCLTAIEASPRIADRLRRLVLLAGMVPFEGVSADDMLRIHFDGAPSQRERHAETTERDLYSVDEMDDATAEWFLRSLTPAEGRPKRPLRTPIYPSRIPPEVPITYVVQTRDRSVPPDVQRRVIANLPRPPEEIVELDSGRNPMILKPRETAAILLRYA